MLQLIADYGVGDPAFAEVTQRLTFLDRNIRVHEISVPAFSTVATGMWIAQFAEVNAYTGLIIFSNTAPRIEASKKTHKIEGGHFCYTRLDNGVMILAVHVGYCFSFIKDEIKSLHLVNIPNEGSQFRSRDHYPDAVVGIATGAKKYVGAEVDLATIPDPPPNLIGFVDGYGNLKTTMRRSQSGLSPGTRVKISVGGVSREGLVSDETYKVKDGEVSFAPGSTGGNDRFMEIWVRGASAWEAFGRPKVEEKFAIQKLWPH